MTDRRSKMEICADILKAIGKKGVPTRVMAAANVSWVPFQKFYIPHLVHAGLVVRIPTDGKNHGEWGRPPKMAYCLTTDGKMVVSRLDELRRRLAL